MKKVLFTEVQQFNQWWLWVLLLGILATFLWSVIQQVILKIRLGDNPAPDFELLVFGLIPFGLLFFFRILRLVTTITKEGIRVDFFPLFRKNIPWTDVEKAYLRTYQPIREFGGWGIRFAGNGGMAYNISGNQGLQLVLKNGKKILIGTQKPEALDLAIRNSGFLNTQTGD